MDSAIGDATVRQLMFSFAERTGLEPESEMPQRYLWTDAFAVCNYLSLYGRSGEPVWLQLALRLVEQVHHTLGRHRPDDRRSGWLSGLTEEEGTAHPTRGGLRIGKLMNERAAGEPPDELLEWDRDGQYFHYLTKWMHALQAVSRMTGEATFLVWAIELAKAIHPRFTDGSPGAPRRLCWKMSIDLTRPLVAAMGQHDPLDGYLTYRQLQTATRRDFAAAAVPDLASELADMEGLCAGRSWQTGDPLGIGGLLFDACRLVQLRTSADAETKLLSAVFDDALAGLDSLAVRKPLRYPAAYRLPFRELGLAIGMQAAVYAQRWIAEHPDQFADAKPKRTLDACLHHLPLGESICSFWSEPENWSSPSWTDHEDINTVMLATSLAPEKFLEI